MGKNSVKLPEPGPECKKCGKPFAVYSHISITDKLRNQPYYFTRWYRCLNGACKTDMVMMEEFKVVNETHRRRRQKGGRRDDDLDQASSKDMADVERMRKLLRRARPFLSSTARTNLDRAAFDQLCREVDAEIEVTTQLEREGFYKRGKRT